MKIVLEIYNTTESKRFKFKCERKIFVKEKTNERIMLPQTFREKKLLKKIMLNWEMNLKPKVQNFRSFVPL